MGKIGGLISSLVLTLVNGPGRYQVFDRLIEKFCGKTKEKTIGELLTAPYHYHEVKEYYYKPELA